MYHNLRHIMRLHTGPRHKPDSDRLPPGFCPVSNPHFREKISGKSILLRTDFNIPLNFPLKDGNDGLKDSLKGSLKDSLKAGAIRDTAIHDISKIKAALPTIRFLLENNCKIVICTHLGQPEGKFAHSLSTSLLAPVLQELVSKEMSPKFPPRKSDLSSGRTRHKTFHPQDRHPQHRHPQDQKHPQYKIVPLDDCIGSDIRRRVQLASSREILLLENLRFYRQEEENDPLFGHALAELAEIYVNDAFGVCHRQHASVEAVTRFLPAAAGLLLEKEIEMLSRALRPERPSIWILGGGKLDKIELLLQALEQADYILIGGALAFPFLQARGMSVGMSKSSHAAIPLARKLLQHRAARKIILPVDFLATEKFSLRAPFRAVPAERLGTHRMALDIGPETIKLFKQYLRHAHTIFWNGPLGYYEWAAFAQGTKEIGRFLGTLDAAKLVGGGETADAFHRFHLSHKVTHVSTGGGAALAFLSGKPLPALEALKRNCLQHKIFWEH